MKIVFQSQVKIGSRSQIFKLLIDTGSYAVWVGKIGCYGQNNITNFYEPDKSITRINMNEIFFFFFFYMTSLWLLLSGKC